MKIIETKKTRKVGNSLVVTLSNEVQEALDIKENDNLVFQLNDNNELVLKSAEQSNEVPQDEFVKLMKQVSKEDFDAFRKLVERW